MKKLWLAFALSLLSTTSFAASLTGTVVDEFTQEPIYGVSVTVGTGDSAKSATTLDNGKFKIKGFEPGTGEYEITFTKEDKEDGYIEQSHIIKIEDYEVFFDEQAQPFQRLSTTQNAAGETIVDPTNIITLPEIKLLPNFVK